LSTANLFSKIFSQQNMKKKKKTESRPIFESIRKPIAPPSQKIGKDKPEEKIHPSLRKTKHKKKDVSDNDV
jgi:hypothetical protein